MYSFPGFCNNVSGICLHYNSRIFSLCIRSRHDLNLCAVQIFLMLLCMLVVATNGHPVVPAPCKPRVYIKGFLARGPGIDASAVGGTGPTIFAARFPGSERRVLAVIKQPQLPANERHRPDRQTDPQVQNLDWPRPPLCLPLLLEARRRRPESTDFTVR